MQVLLYCFLRRLSVLGEMDVGGWRWVRNAEGEMHCVAVDV